MRIPILSLPKVFHVGTLDRDQRHSDGSSSFEGHCLSVSLHPRAWTQIAKLGGRETFALERSSSPGAFIDYLSIESDPVTLDAVRKTAAKAGYAREVQAWRAWMTDEDGDWRYMILETEAEAIAEATSCGDGLEDLEAPRGHKPVEAVAHHRATPALLQRIGFNLDGLDATPYALMVIADDIWPEVDGMWWLEDFNPSALSAPRGGIFPSRLDAWASRLAKPGEDNQSDEHWSLATGSMDLPDIDSDAASESLSPAAPCARMRAG